MVKLGFIGAGTVGTALATRLSGKGYQVVAASSRSSSSAQNLARTVNVGQALGHQGAADTAELALITTTDYVIA